MTKSKRGSEVAKFSTTERKLSLNYQSLGISLAVAVLTWASVELIPDLQEHGGMIGAIAGLVAQIVPMLILYLRNNKDTTIDVKDKK